MFAANDEPTFRVATWNVHEGLRAGSTTFDQTLRTPDVRFLQALHIDVIALQELDVDGAGQSHVLDQVQDIGGLEHGHMVAVSTSAFDPVRLAAIGLASRFPLTDVEYVPLPNPSQYISSNKPNRSSVFDKGTLSATFSFDGHDIRVMSIHAYPFHRFGVAPEDERVSIVWRALSSQIDRRPEQPFVGAGDFNTDRRDLVSSRSKRVLKSTMSGLLTHRREAVDDVVVSSELIAHRPALAVNTFSDHMLCAIDIQPRGAHGHDADSN